MRCFRYGGWIISLTVLAASASGCRPATFLAGAAISRGAQWRTGANSSGLWTFNGLDASVPPRIRPGSYATATHGVHFIDAASLGPHSYRFLWSECNGITYACQAGHVDVAHVRKAVDWAGYLAATTLGHLERGQTHFRFKQREPSVYFITLGFPPGWDSLDDARRERIAREVSRELGCYLAFTALTWHEILTWFGYRPRPHVSEFPSAFSWEDTYSNLLGMHIAAAALADESLPFNEAVARILARWIEELGGQPADVAKQAAETVRGQWYSSNWFTTVIRERNFDLGLDDGYVSPSLVPGVSACPSAEARPLPVPTLNALRDHGFSAHVEIEVRGWEERRIFAALGPDAFGPTRRIDPAVQFSVIMRYIERDASRRWE